MSLKTKDVVFFTLLFIYCFLACYVKLPIGHLLSCLVLSLVFITVASVTYVLMYSSKDKQKDNFQFEVTPQKTKCLSAPYKYYPPDDLCPYCCPRFMRKGIPVNFEYSSDAERGNPCEGCGCPSKRVGI